MNDKILLEYIQLLGLTNEEFAKYIDVSYDTLKTWLYRNKKVPKRKVDFVLNKIKLHKSYTDSNVVKPIELNENLVEGKTAGSSSLEIENFAKLPIEEKLNYIFKLCVGNTESIEKVISMLEGRDSKEDLQEKLDKKIKEELDSIKIEHKH